MVGDITEALSALIIAIGLFCIFSVIGGPTIGLGAALLVIGVYLGYAAQFVTLRKGSQ